MRGTRRHDGGDGGNGPSWEVGTGDWWADVETNLRGTFLTSRRALPSMISSGHGRIVAVSTYGINRPMPYLSAYAAAKSGIAAYAEALSTEVMEHEMVSRCSRSLLAPFARACWKT